MDANGNEPPHTFFREMLAQGGAESGIGEADMLFVMAAVGEMSLRALARVGLGE